ncbi:hypothetical protein P5V15_006623 [Pogonomyrmex californicus]
MTATATAATAAAAVAATAAISTTVAAATTTLTAGKRGFLGAEPWLLRRTLARGDYRKESKGEEWVEEAMEAAGVARKGGQQSSCHALKYVPG